MPADHFSTRWTGFLQPRFDETYTLTTVSDDTVRLWLRQAADRQRAPARPEGGPGHGHLAGRPPAPHPDRSHGAGR
ncbi:PA14 domain-containing protein [Streptomyces sp. NRRL S-1448]|uniref:PA14 domain-containing protein n=1 Tax=Streptomyces sp. NRRL S-1448 TaxID=1463883 RepID=UPI003B637EB7